MNQSMSTTCGRSSGDERPDEQHVAEPEERARDAVAVDERGVDGQHRGHVAAAGPDRAHPREVEELAVLVHDVGTEVVEDLEQPAEVARAHRDRDVVVEREAGLRRREARQPHDPVAVSDLVGRGVAVCGGDDEHLVTQLGEVLREAFGEVDAPARPGHEEVVDHRDAHDVAYAFPGPCDASSSSCTPNVLGAEAPGEVELVLLVADVRDLRSGRAPRPLGGTGQSPPRRPRSRSSARRACAGRRRGEPATRSSGQRSRKVSTAASSLLVSTAMAGAEPSASITDDRGDAVRAASISARATVVPALHVGIFPELLDAGDRELLAQRLPRDARGWPGCRRSRRPRPRRACASCRSVEPGEAVDLVAGNQHVAHVDHADPVEVGREG